MGIVAAFFVGDMVQIHDEAAPGVVQARLLRPGDDGYMAAAVLVAEFEGGREPSAEFADAPPRPSMGHEWVSGAWVDARTQEDMEAALQALRNVTSMTRADFNEACMERGLMAASDLEGDTIPAIIDAMLPYDRTIMLNRWRNSSVIDRMSPFILYIQSMLDLSDAFVDELFGIAAR